MFLAPFPAFAEIEAVRGGLSHASSGTQALSLEEEYDKLIESRTGKSEALPELTQTPEEVEGAAKPAISTQLEAPAPAFFAEQAPAPVAPAPKAPAPVAPATPPRETINAKSPSSDGGPNGLVIGGGVALAVVAAVVLSKGPELPEGVAATSPSAPPVAAPTPAPSEAETAIAPAESTETQPPSAP